MPPLIKPSPTHTASKIALNNPIELPEKSYNMLILIILLLIKIFFLKNLFFNF